MNTNINIDNYEAYLLDYMEGNLSHEESAELKTFIATQGLDWDELTAPLPYLEASQTVYESKERLKKKAVVVPMYVKIALTAASAGLLFTLVWKPNETLPKQELLAELEPIKAQLSLSEKPMPLIPRKTVQFVSTQPVESHQTEKTKTHYSHSEKAESLVIAELSPLKPETVVLLSPTEPDAELEMKMEMLRYRMESDLTLANLSDQALEEEIPASFIGRTIYRWSEGRYSSIIGLLNAGLGIAKKEVSAAATDVVLATYSNISEQMAEAKHRWQEKTEE